MDEVELRRFVKEVLDLQVQGTVGNEEEREVWKEMKNHFQDEFLANIEKVIQGEGGKELKLDEEEEHFQQRLELLKLRQEEPNQTIEDMWNYN